MGIAIARRKFVAGLSAAAAWPLTARAQQPVRVRRIGALLGDLPRLQPSWDAFVKTLGQLGWTEGQNLRLDLRGWGRGETARIQELADELVALHPDVLVSGSTPATSALRRVTQTIPIVFAAGGDPVERGYVAGLAHPGGNVTGFFSVVPSLASKWLELLREVDPRVVRIAVMFDARFDGDKIYAAPIEEAAAATGVRIIRTPVGNKIEVERALDTFAAGPNGGLIIIPPPMSGDQIETIIQRAVQSRLPAVYFRREEPVAGGLMSYGSSLVDGFIKAASYVDRILKGANPADLPVQQPTKFELVVNLKTAKAIDLTIPESFLLRADEVIE